MSAYLPSKGRLNIKSIASTFAESSPFVLATLATNNLPGATAPYAASDFYGAVGPGTPYFVPDRQVLGNTTTFSRNAGKFAMSFSYSTGNAVVNNCGNLFNWSGGNTTLETTPVTSTVADGGTRTVTGPYVQVTMTSGGFALDGVVIRLRDTAVTTLAILGSPDGGATWVSVVNGSAASNASSYISAGSSTVYTAFRFVMNATSPAPPTAVVILGMQLTSASGALVDVIPDARVSAASGIVGNVATTSSVGASNGVSAFDWDPTTSVLLPGYSNGTGAYTGTTKTSFNRVRTAPGEWIQVSSNAFSRCGALQLTTPAMNALAPSSVRVLGSIDGGAQFFNVACAENLAPVTSNTYTIPAECASPFNTYRVVFTSAVPNANAASSLQVSQMAVLPSVNDITERLVPAAPVSDFSTVATTVSNLSPTTALMSGQTDPCAPYTITASSSYANTSPATLLAGGAVANASPLQYWATAAGSFKNRFPLAPPTTSNIVQLDGSVGNTFPGEYVELSISGAGILPTYFVAETPASQFNGYPLYQLAQPRWVLWLGSADSGATWYALAGGSNARFSSPTKVWPMQYVPGSGQPTAFKRFRFAVNSITDPSLFPTGTPLNPGYLALSRIGLLY